MLRDAGFDPVTLDEFGVTALAEEESVEAFNTFEENSLAKARYYFGRAQALGTRAPFAVLADDSGLEVNALGGAPGVWSKRWSGAALEGQALDDANNAKLVAALRGAKDRSARYVCVAAFKSGELELHARGACAGEILESPRGSDGFGYDPYFYSEELQKSFGEATRVEKEVVSHRARAVRALLELLRAAE
jgi:XTP/dITP diphosphohydrolase